MIKNEYTKAVAIPDHCRVVLSDRVTPAQKDKHIIGKGRVRHPAVNFTLTFKETDDKNRVYGIVQDSLDKNKNWIPRITLAPGLMDAFVTQFKKGSTPEEAWYLGLLGKTAPMPTDENANPALGIVDILIEQSTEKMHEAGIVARCTLVTDIGEFRGITVTVSAFGTALRCAEPNADDNDYDKGQVYRLSDEAKAQILAYFHNHVIDWANVEARRDGLQTMATERALRKAEEYAAKLAAQAQSVEAAATASAEVDEAFEAAAGYANIDSELPA